MTFWVIAFSVTRFCCGRTKTVRNDKFIFGEMISPLGAQRGRWMPPTQEILFQDFAIK